MLTISLNMDIELKNWLFSGKYRIEVLKILSQTSSIPSEIAKKLDIHRSSITRILKDLLTEGLVAKTKKNAKKTTYFLSEKGKEISKEIKS
jgi:DNA-binding MarR family transcriptional regulator